MRDTVTDGNNRAHVGQLDLALIMRDLLLIMLLISSSAIP